MGTGRYILGGALLLAAGMIGAPPPAVAAFDQPPVDCARPMNDNQLLTCVVQERDEADAALADALGKLLAQLKHPEDQTRLKEAEAAWLAFRDKECSYRLNGPMGVTHGFMWEVRKTECDADLAEARTRQLRSYLQCPGRFEACPEYAH